MNRNYHQDMSVVRVNTMPDRAFYIPCAPGKAAFEKEGNERVVMLNGTWEFAWFSSFEQASLEAEKCGTIEVPSNWQFFGYDNIQYVNIDYPIPYMPPFVPKQNPCGRYRRTVWLCLNRRERYFLNLEGADSCHYLFVNGTFAGYGQVSHSSGEYEVTRLLRDGNNEFVVFVLKWCDGTYLEDQDKFRLSGIFRDIYLLRRPRNFIFDYAVKTRLTAEGAAVCVSLTDMQAGLFKKLTLYDRDGKLIAEKTTEGTQAVLPVKDPVCWNAEQPYLYRLELETAEESILEAVGIREITVENKLVLLNGKKILLKGVNRHESHPDTGYVCSRERMIKDLKMMKQANLNAIRTSHYPDCPEFYRLCDEYGFYVMDEADIETHGAWSCQGVRDNENYNMTQKDPQFELPFLDRVRRLVARDKNRPCVLFWSLGNESGYGRIACRAAEVAHEMDDTRLVHYESTQVSSEEEGKFDESCLDVEGIMYPELERIHEYFEKEYEKPLILTEFAHAMGNGPGGLKEYFDCFYRYPSLAGGFVWEWCDHAVLRKGEHGSVQYLYGGDFGEKLHDGNFCVDGLVYPDRRPHTGLKELANCARPVRITCAEGHFYLENCMDFTDFKDILYLKWEIRKDGQPVRSGRIEGISVLPGERKECLDGLGIFRERRVFLKFDIYTKCGSGLLEADTLLGFEQFLLSEDSSDVKREKTANTAEAESPAAEKTEDGIRITGKNFSCFFDKEAGGFSSFIYGGKEYLHGPMEYQLYRAPTDNDMAPAGRSPGIPKNWKAMGLDQVQPYTGQCRVQKQKGCIEISCPVILCSPHLIPPVRLQTTYTVYGNGGIRVRISGRVREDIPWLPRFGVRFLLDDSMNLCRFFGYGPQESYPDRKEGCYCDWFRSQVEEMFENYIRPQENGSHCGTECCLLSDGERSLCVTAEKPFSFCASKYTWEELEKKAHHFELEKSGYTVLHLDYAMSGLGTGSCGPLTRTEYCLTEKKFEFSFLLGWQDGSL